MGFIRSMAVDGQTRSNRELADAWRKANEHVRLLEQQEAGWADGAPLLPLPEEMQPQRLRLLNDPIFQRAFQNVPSDVCMIELDRLVVYQKYIDLNHVRRIRSGLPDQLTPQELFEICLPSKRDNPPVRAMQTAQNSYTFLSPSNDFRFLQTDLLTRDQVRNWPAIGPVASVVGLVVGYGSNFLTALHADGRTVLGNGSHRAYALREHGVTHVPCIVQRVSQREELELVAAPELIHHPDRFFRAPRPALLKDYFDPALRMIVPVARKNRMVKVSFSIETVDIPA